MDKQVEDLAFGVDGAPQIHLPAADPDEHLVEVPAPVRDWTPRPQPACDQRAEDQHPAPDRLVGDLDTALGQEFLDISVAEGTINALTVLH